jgi:hypothetical protein
MTSLRMFWETFNRPVCPRTEKIILQTILCGYLLFRKHWDMAIGGRYTPKANTSSVVPIAWAALGTRPRKGHLLSFGTGG